MKHSKVIVPWREGLHLRRAVSLMLVARYFRSSIFLRCGTKIADLRSIIGIISLCATMGTVLDVEVRGDDETEATRAMQRAFASHDATISPVQAQQRSGWGA
jgi:phosphotransferase system HPr (HPr) family protein